MLQGSTIRWFTFDITREFDFGSGKPSFERDFRAFVFRSNGHYVDVISERFATTFVDDAHGRSDFGIGKRGYVLLKKVDQAAFALKQGEELKGGGGVGFFGFVGDVFFGRLGGLGGGLERERFANLEGPSCEGAVEENAEETGPGEPEARSERKRGDVGHGRRVTRVR